jgi:hypothetical protein
MRIAAINQFIIVSYIPLRMNFSTICISAILALTLGQVAAGTLLDATPAWTISPGERPYITTTSTERSLSYNSSSGNLLLTTRGGGHRIIVMDPADGNELRIMDVTGITGGTFLLNQGAAAEDGAVYACNLVTPATATSEVIFKIYRWNSDAAGVTPTVAWSGDPAGASGGVSNSTQRWGDTMAVRGSGINTQIIVGTGAVSLGSPAVVITTGVAYAIFTTTDGVNFTPTFYSSGLESGGNKGIAFGEGNTFYSKANGAAKKIRRNSFTLSPPSTTLLQDFTVAGNQLVPLATQFSPTEKYLATIDINNTSSSNAGVSEIVKLYDISNPANIPNLLDQETLPVNNVNSNVVGSITLGGGRVYCCATNDGIQAYNISVTPDVIPPTISASPADRAVYVRGQTTLEVSVTGTPPFTYQWYKDTVLIPGAQSSSFTINPVTDGPTGSAGGYVCRVTNSANFAESTVCNVTTIPSVDSNVLSPLWNLAPNVRPYLQADDTQRGIAYHPGNQRVYLVSRTPSPAILILDANTGADLGSLNLTGVAGGNFSINMIDVADDGVIYACNLSNTTTGADFKVYRWIDDQPTTLPIEVYNGNPFDADGEGPLLGARLGDTLDVRGSGSSTQIVAGARSVNRFALLTTSDGTNFVINALTATGAVSNAFGLGICFGEGNTLWGKALGQGLTYLGVDLSEGTSSVIHFFPTTSFSSAVGPIAFDAATCTLTGLALENSDNVRAYHVPVPYPSPSPSSLTLLDQEFMVSDNLNANGTGAVTTKAGRVFVVNTFNGIAAYSISRGVTPTIGNVSYNSTSGEITFKLKGEAGVSYLIQRSTDLSSPWTPDGVETLSAAEQDIVRPATGAKVFFRATRQ